MTKSSPARAILVGGGVAGAFDLTFAMTFFYVRNGGNPVKVPYAVASGVLGMDAFKGGAGIAALGVALHFLIALGAATVFFIASRAIGALTRYPLVFGPLFGACVYLMMNLVIVPLSNAPKFRYDVTSVTADLACHMLLIGPSIALAARRWAAR